MYIQIVGGRIYTPTGWIDGGSVLVEGKKIKAILNTDLPIEGARQLDARGSYIIPGGIEMHVHGAAGADYMDGTVEAFRTASDYHLQQGTTTIFPTLSTSSYETIMKGIECTEILMKDDESTVEGLHLEGPYFSVKMAGAQLPELIRPARPEEYTKIMERGDGVIKRWDAAPEIEVHWTSVATSVSAVSSSHWHILRPTTSTSAQLGNMATRSVRTSTMR